MRILSQQSFIALSMLLSIGMLSVYSWDPFKEIKKVTEDVQNTGKSIVRNTQKNVEADVRKAQKETVEVAAAVSKVFGQSIGEFGKVTAPLTGIVTQFSGEATGTLAKLGLPTDPRKLIEFALSKMTDEQIKNLGKNIMSALMAQLSDISKMQSVVLQPVHAVAELIPLIPSSDMISDFLLDFTICKYQFHTFAQLKAFHVLTHFKYATEAEKTMIKEQEEFEKSKGLIGQTVDLNKARNLSRQVSDLIKKFIDPLQQLVKKLEYLGSPLLKPLEALGREFRPTPIACLVSGGFIYNRAIFICHIKLIEGLFQDTMYIFERNLDRVERDKNWYALLVDWEKDPIASTFMKILRAGLSPTNELFGRVDEMFVDPIADLPWALKSVATMTLTLTKLSAKLARWIIKEITSEISSISIAGVAGTAVGTVGSVAPGGGTVVGAGGGGGSSYTTAQIITKTLSEVINENFVLDMIAETFYWSWIRYIEKRLQRVKALIAQAQADGISFNSGRFKEVYNNIIQFKNENSYYKQQKTEASPLNTLAQPIEKEPIQDVSIFDEEGEILNEFDLGLEI